MPAPAPYEAAVRRALSRRDETPVGPGTDVLRVVHDAADELPGLVVDVYGHVARIETYTDAWRSELPALASMLVTLRPQVSVVIGFARQARGRGEWFSLVGQAPKGHVVHEDGHRYFVRTAEPDAAGTGIFVDHREGRRLVRAVAAGRPMLNLFGHAGAFGVAGFAGGATRIDHVDAGKKCAPWAALNLALNGANPRQHRFIIDDAFKVLRRASRRGPQYGVIVCDPPTTALNPDGSRFLARTSLATLAEDASRALLPGGYLLLSTNDRSVSPDEILARAEEGVARAGRAVRDAQEVPLGPDIPAHHEPRLRPMRGAWLRLSS